MPRAGKQVELQRQDGYVTAAEVSRATGRALSSVHDLIQSGKIPGQRIGWSWYVDIHGFYKIAQSDYPEGSTVEANLKKLVATVGRPASPQRAARPAAVPAKKRARKPRGGTPHASR